MSYNLEHPDITYARRKGYPRSKKENLYIDYSTHEDNKQINLTDVINKVAIYMDKLADHGVINMSYNHGTDQYEVLFFDIRKFYEESEGEYIRFVHVDSGAQEMFEAFYERFGIKYKMLLDREEYDKMTEMIESEGYK